MKPHDVPGTTPTEACETLAMLAADVPADQVIVELGVYLGRTACFLAYGAAMGNGAGVFGVDVFMSEGRLGRHGAYLHEARSNIAECGLSSQVRLVEGRSTRVGRFWSTDRPIGLLFVDAEHTYEGVKSDVMAWRPPLAEGATVVFDDYDDLPKHAGVRQCVDELVADGVLRAPLLLHGRLAICKFAPG
jgi:predicted O-methyltransferase YrrM